MVSMRLLSVVGLAVASVSASSSIEEPFAALLRRQAPGTPQFNCHDNCGQALIASRGADPCTKEVFLTDYKACIQCAGPDNVNIWSIYGPRLSAAGGKCGLQTEPASGAQPTVPPAIPAASGAPAPTGPPTGIPTGAPTAVSTPPSVLPTTTASRTSTPATQPTNAAAKSGDHLGFLVVGALGAVFVGIN